MNEICGVWHDHWNRCHQPKGHLGEHWDHDRIRWEPTANDSTERPLQSSKFNNKDLQHNQFRLTLADLMNPHITIISKMKETLKQMGININAQLDATETTCTVTLSLQTIKD